MRLQPMPRFRRSPLFLLAGLVLASACSSQVPTPQSQEDDQEITSGRCGVERWAVKTGTDSQAGQVNLTPQDATVTGLDVLPTPSSLPASGRIAPTELQAVRLTNVTLVQYKLENDGDYHLVLNQGGQTMIGEIPDPANCVGSGSPFAAAIAQARAALDAKYTVSGSFQNANIPVTITGVGFFDAKHGQTGVAPNAIELHPVLGICFGADCGGGTSTPDFSLAANPPSVASSSGAAASTTIAVTGAGGFSGNVALSASGLPAGASATFSAPSIAGGGSSTLTLTPGSAAPGSYTVTVAAVSGSLSHSTTVAWSIALGAQPDFSLSAFPLQVTSNGGAAATSTIALQPQNGFAGTVALTTTGAPSGAQVSLSATNVAGSGNVALTLAPGTAAAGTYSIDVRGTSGALAHDAQLSWTISGTGGGKSPPVAQIQLPAAGSTVSGTITVIASATGSNAIASIEIDLDGARLGIASKAQFSQAWDTTSVANGPHALTAIAIDSAGVTGTSSAISVTVNNAVGPPPTTQDLIVNGGFEMSLTGWTLGGAKLPIASTAHPHGGAHSMRLGATSSWEPNGDSYGFQEVSIPAASTSAVLNFWYYAASTDTVQYDWQEALILDGNGNVLQTIFHMADDSRTWTRQTVDLSAYAGQTVLVFFNCHGDGYIDPTTLWVDDVSLIVSAGTGGTATPPSTAITSPVANAVLSGTVSIAATASDAAGVTNVEFDVDGTLLANSTTAPYRASWDTTSAGNGAHTLTTRATDAAGLVGASAGVVVTVNNGGPPPPPDTTPPTIALTSPATGAIVSGSVAITAAATDNVGVTRVEFYIDNVLLSATSSSPYSASWNSSSASNATHTIGARAYDAAGNVGSATAVSVTVNNAGPGDTTPPTVSISTPANGATVSGTATIAASASDNVGVTRVEFYVDGTLLQTIAAAPYTAAWNTTTASNASHSLTAKAYDAAGNVGASAAVSVTVNNVVAGGIHTVFVILMENHNWSAIKGSSSAPYINNTLLAQGAHAENYLNPPGNHPSLPNYLWLEAGTNFGVANDSAPSVNHQGTTQHLVTLLQSANIPWKNYEEGITGTSCPLTTSGLYAPKHNAAVYFDDVTSNSSSSANCIAHVRPYSELSADLAAGRVAGYNFITPNLCDDMHNSSGCSSSDAVANGDTWLSQNVPQILNSAAYRNGGALFITWDESEGGDSPIGMIVLSPKAKAGYSNTVSYTHSSMLRTAQEIFQVSPMLGDAANATDLGDLFQSFP